MPGSIRCLRLGEVALLIVLDLLCLRAMRPAVASGAGALLGYRPTVLTSRSYSKRAVESAWKTGTIEAMEASWKRKCVTSAGLD